MSVKDRFFKAYDYLKEVGRIRTLLELAEILNTNKQGISDIKADRKKLTVENLGAFVEAFPEISLIWLINNTGSMNISCTAKATSNLMVKEPEPIYNRMPQVITTDSEGRNNIILVPVKAAAGYLNGYGDREFIEKLPTYSLPNIQNGTFRMFQVGGHSMYPTLHNGAYVVGSFVENWVKDIKDDRVYVIISRNDGIIVKRCLNRIKKYGSIYCKSDNRKEYPSYAVQPEDIIEVWEYKMHLAFELPNPADLYDRVSDLEATVQFLESKIGKKIT